MVIFIRSTTTVVFESLSKSKNPRERERERDRVCGKECDRVSHEWSDPARKKSQIALRAPSSAPGRLTVFCCGAREYCRNAREPTSNRTARIPTDSSKVEAHEEGVTGTWWTAAPYLAGDAPGHPNARERLGYIVARGLNIYEVTADWMRKLRLLTRLILDLFTIEVRGERSRIEVRTSLFFSG